MPNYLLHQIQQMFEAARLNLPAYFPSLRRGDCPANLHHEYDSSDDSSSSTGRSRRSVPEDSGGGRRTGAAAEDRGGQEGAVVRHTGCHQNPPPVRCCPQTSLDVAAPTTPLLDLLSRRLPLLTRLDVLSWHPESRALSGLEWRALEDGLPESCRRLSLPSGLMIPGREGRRGRGSAGGGRGRGADADLGRLVGLCRRHTNVTDVTLSGQISVSSDLTCTHACISTPHMHACISTPHIHIRLVCCGTAGASGRG